MTRAPGSAAVAPHLRRARVGVSLIFFTNGIVLGGFAPRVPELRDQLGISYGALGVAMAMWSIGALALGLLAAAMIRRFRSSRVATVAMVVSATAMLAAGLAPNVWTFGAALFVVGATDAWVDVAQNAHGLRVQRLYRRSILNSFHALWSIGAVSGGLIGGLAAGLGVAVPWQFALGLVIVIAANAVAYPLLLAGPEPAHAGEEGADETPMPHPQHLPLRHVPLRTWGLLLALTVIAIAGGWAEDAASTWSASYMRDELAAGATLAALAFVAMQGCQFIGRLLGDGMVDRWGQRTVARWGGALVAVGMGLALAFPSPWGTIVGFGAAGFGVATLIPGAMHAADELPGLRTGTGLTVLSWLLRVAFLLSPPVVGAIADATSLRVGLTLVPVFGVLVVVLAGAMATRKEPHPAVRDAQSSS
ncbi:MFS transporter [Demequina sp. SYSU T00192]|uniref:MFS transporter n=1 Tax=Demequina litoralis TaxID=3051660 RepID=A0ABT8GBP3_9MICO|nr:MFS transporter [Demequina sp. SYSU T00192]MDN4476561.1 MFS transporter [Demequina sp. SYSU T00192]